MKNTALIDLSFEEALYLSAEQFALWCILNPEKWDKARKELIKESLK